VEIRLQKFLADSGVASRRACEALIIDGRVSIDGFVVTKLGTRINPKKHKVEVDGKAIRATDSKTYIAFYKPRGILSTMSDPRSRPNIGDFFKGNPIRLFYVGRLDKESEGLILLTNDGEWAQQIAHPKFGIEKKYLVETDRPLSQSEVRHLTSGVKIEGGVARANQARLIGGLLEVSIHEGRNQVVRKMIGSLGIEVLSLARTQIGWIHLGELKAGKWRYLSNIETINRDLHKTTKR
jgi:pseudouridine synthase